MGEKIRDLSEAPLKNGKVIFELNENQNEKDEYDIHIEAPMFRFSMSDSNYMLFANAVFEARRKLLNTKKI